MRKKNEYATLLLNVILFEEEVVRTSNWNGGDESSDDNQLEWD